MVYGRNLVYLCQTCEVFVGEERTHKDAMKTVIALYSSLQIAKGFNS